MLLPCPDSLPLMGTTTDMPINCCPMFINYLDSALLHTFFLQYFIMAKFSDDRYDMHTIIWESCL